MDVFKLRNRLIEDYANYVESFILIRDNRIKDHLQNEISQGLLWPYPLIQLNPSFEPGEYIDELVDQKILHEECRNIFRRKQKPNEVQGPLRLHRHQADAIKIAGEGHNYVLTTGTGSGKSLAYIVPIVDYALRVGPGGGIKAIIIYPMNALANSQEGELTKFLCHGYPDAKPPVTFARYTGQESDERRQEIIADPPDILLTNYVMLELLLTRPYEKQLIGAAKGLKFLVLDELHTYRGRQGADVSMLVRRARDAFEAEGLQCVGTSATLAGGGAWHEQQKEVAEIATQIFGASVKPEHIIGESLKRATQEKNLEDPQFIAELKLRIADENREPPDTYNEFIEDPLSIWIETTLGLEQEVGSGQLTRAKPLSIIGEGGAAEKLSRLTGLEVDACTKAIEKHLLASYRCETNPETGFPVFAFRLHQFISRGDTLYASLEPEPDRHITVQGQQYVPGDRDRLLYSVVFCRECGQEYYCVQITTEDEGERRRFEPRDFSDRLVDEEGEAGYIYLSTEEPWPDDPEEVLQRLPDEWLEAYKGTHRVKKTRRRYLPRDVRIGPDGLEDENGIDCHFIPTPFRFCLHCGVSYRFTQRTDFPKLATLGTEGRSTATTILSLAAIRFLKNTSLEQRAKKLLSFTDNRQDASLQAGHFNDFVEVGLLRSALYEAAVRAGAEGIEHDELVRKVFDVLDLPLELYAIDPGVKFAALEDTKKALRNVLGYRLYRDLRRGWRITVPNLEQCGLLEIRYKSIDELCGAQDVWDNRHESLVTASSKTRTAITKTLLDFMRRELSVKVEYLNEMRQEQIQQQSFQRLLSPWSIDENEKMETASVLFPRSQRPGDYRGFVYLSARGGFGQYLRRDSTLPEYHGKLSLDQTDIVIRQLLEVLRIAGLVEMVSEPKENDDVPGYQIPASAFTWVAGDGTKPFHDPISIPRVSERGGRVNPFFVEFYRSIAKEGMGLEAREHTAQVQYEERIDREERFREGVLPILYCSPTMELGVDIAELNAVNLRNIPPTPANYAQRSGRAGRSGQPALVFSYCSTFSSHDQYFFKRPQLMVAGSVTPPRLDLANEDLIRAHVHAVWLAETGLSLGTSLKDILDVSGEEPTLTLKSSVRDDIQNESAKKRARVRAKKVLASISGELGAADWYSEGWVDEVLAHAAIEFDRACERWRGLYRAALNQQVRQNIIIKDASRNQEEKNRAKRLRAEAERQLELLAESHNVIQADFYSYRYFASEGFLPGYNFPRLPLSAYIPGRRMKKGRDEFLSRPRFLAISEFGPRAIVYHEGSRYRINRVILPVDEQGEDALTTSAKQCRSCGYLHPVREGEGPDLCEMCGVALGPPLRQLFRLQNVSTRRAEKINSDEEERLRLGYELKTWVRFAEHDGVKSFKISKIKENGNEVATMTYGQAATLWRVNLGWTRRANRNQYGFLLDVERGYWSRNQQDTEDDAQDPISDRTMRVIPYVEDRKNCLLIEPAEKLTPQVAASLQSALKNAIQVTYQLEEFELAAEPLPDRDDRRILLFYEAAEGGAGVLRRLVEDSRALRQVARQALDLCHFDPESGEDRKRAPKSKEDCEAACYDCLMSYSNQRDHRLLDRKKIKDLLIQLARAEVKISPAPLPRAEHFRRLVKQCQSTLEKKWLEYLEGRKLNLPSHAQKFIEKCKTRPDFLYEKEYVAVYVDGPHHHYPERKERDRDQEACMEDAGYTVIRFGHDEDWGEIVSQHKSVFGSST